MFPFEPGAFIEVLPKLQKWSLDVTLARAKHAQSHDTEATTLRTPLAGKLGTGKLGPFKARLIGCKLQNVEVVTVLVLELSADKFCQVSVQGSLHSAENRSCPS